MRAGTLSGGMKMNLVVQKFGGTSVKDAQRVFNVAKIVTQTPIKRETTWWWWFPHRETPPMT